MYFDAKVSNDRMKTDFRSDEGIPISEFQVQAANLEPKQQSERLREAVRKAGGARTVAMRSGVPFGTLNHYIGGGQMKLPAATALARACGVSLEWLATGIETATSQSQVAAPWPSNDPPAPASTRLFNNVNIDKLAEALETVLAQLARGKITRPWHQVLQAAILVYDLMQEPEDG